MTPIADLSTLVPELQRLVATGNFPPDYACYLAGMGLDPNRQRIILWAYRDNPRPTWRWFKTLVCEHVGHTQEEMPFMRPLFEFVESEEGS